MTPTNLGAFRTFGNLEVEPWCPKRLLGLPTGSDKTYALEITSFSGSMKFYVAYKVPCKERHSCPHTLSKVYRASTSKPSVTISQSHQNVAFWHCTCRLRCLRAAGSWELTSLLIDSIWNWFQLMSKTERKLNLSPAPSTKYFVLIPSQITIENDFPSPKVRYVSSLAGIT